MSSTEGRGSLEDLTELPRGPLEGRLDSPLRDLWLERARLHFNDSYAGITMTKFPEDLRVYEHLLWAAAPRVVIEIGVQFGGSALWFRDRLRTLARYGRVRDPHVIGVDVATARAEANLTAVDPDWKRSITLIESDIRDPRVHGRIAEAIRDGASCLVVEDGAHEYDTTLAALDQCASFVGPEGYFVVEDGCVDVEEMRLDASWPRGVLPAVSDWLRSSAGGAFVQRRDLELYGMTCHPGGFLQRRAAAHTPS